MEVLRCITPNYSRINRYSPLATIFALRNIPVILRLSFSPRIAICLLALLLSSCLESERKPEIRPQDLALITELNGLYQWGGPKQDQSTNYVFIEAEPDKQYRVRNWDVSFKGDISGRQSHTIGIVPLQVDQEERYLVLVSNSKGQTFYGELQKNNHEFTFGLYSFDKNKSKEPSVQATVAQRGIRISDIKIAFALDGLLSTTTLRDLFSDQVFRTSLTVSPIALTHIAESHWSSVPIPADIAERVPNISIKEFPQLSDAMQGNPNAQYSLGHHYLKRKSGSLDTARARHWFEQAARQGHVKAQADLAELFFRADGDAQDYTQARYWHEQAAKQGHGYSHYILGWMYANGKGVSADYDQARQWLEQGVKQGDANSHQLLGWLHANGKGVQLNYYLARKLYQKAAEVNIANAQYGLGELLAYGRGGPQDYATARQLYEQAGKQGHVNAQYALGQLYAQGHGGPQNYAQARYWYRQAADQGHRDAQFNLAETYYSETQGGQDYSQARYWYRQAADQGHVESKLNLAMMYSKGKGGDEDQVQASIWMKEAANDGDAMAQYNIGIRYLQGKGVTQDEERGLQWIKRSAEQGYTHAKKLLDDFPR